MSFVSVESAISPALLTTYSELPASTIAAASLPPISKIHHYILDYLNRPENKCPITGSWKPRVLKVIFSIGGILAKVPLVPIAFSFSSQNTKLAYFGASLNFIAFSSLGIWSSKKMIEDVFLSLKTTEPHLSTSYDRCRKISLFAFNVLNALGAQIPYLYLSWYYNDNKPYMLGFNVLDIAIPIYSLNLMMTRKLSNLAFSTHQKKIGLLKHEMLAKLDNKIKALNQTDCPDFIEAFSHLQESEHDDVKMGRFLDLVLTDDLVPLDTCNPCLDDLKLSSAKVIGLLLLSVQVFWNAFLTYKAVSHVTQDPTLNGLACLYVVICHIALVRFVLIKSTYQCLNGLTLPCQRSNRTYNYISDRLAPGSSLVTKAVLLFICSASFIQALKLSYDFLPESFSVPSAMTYGLGLALMNYLPMRDLMSELSSHLIFRFGNQSQKTQAKVHRSLSLIKKLFEHTSLDSFAIFLLNNQEKPMVGYLMTKHQVSLEDLKAFVKQQHQSRFTQVINHSDIFDREFVV